MFFQPARGIQINRTHPLAKNLIGYWICNDGTGKKVWDYSGNANQGTLEGTAPAWSAGRKGWAVNFPGSNERLDCGNKPPLDQIGNGSFWISLWMKSKDAVPLSYGALFLKYESVTNQMHLSSNATENRIRFYMDKSATPCNAIFSTDSAPFDTNWHHIVLVVNRITDKALLYIDTAVDAVQGDCSGLPADASNTANVSWGALSDGSARPYEGALDELRIYTGVPTQEIINWLYWESYALFKPWRRQYQFFPDRMFLTFNSQIPGLAVAGIDMGLTITGDRG